MRMKIFESPQKDLEKNLSLRLDVIQKQLRLLRDDNSQMSKDLSTIVKGIALLVAAPEVDDEQQQLDKEGYIHIEEN